MSKTKADEPSLQALLDELERICTGLQDGELSLEQSISDYERGVELLAKAQHILDVAEQRIRVLSGEPDETEGDEAPDAAVSDDDDS
jgi:exodeoxyribonuclease VII small subunit